MSAIHFGCVNNTIRLRSGRYFDLANPQPDQFRFSDIAGGLAKMCRFSGQVFRFYSVAEHCCLCSTLAKNDGLSDAVQRSCLLHDAAEAFIGDITKPLKIMLPEYQRIERRIEEVIAAKYGVDLGQEDVKRIDREMLMNERRQLFSQDKVTWTGEDQVRRIFLLISCLDPGSAETRFTTFAKGLGLEVDQ